MARNVVRADFSSAGDNRYISTKRRDQYNYGQKLEIIGLNLPDTFEVDFCNEEDPDTITVIGQNNVVDIPDQFFETGRGILAYIYLHEGTDDGETEYRIFIPVGARAERTDAEPTPVQQDVITQAIAALNEGVERAEAAAEEIESMQVEAETLEPGSEATASWEDGTLTLGIPKGIQGEAGIQGERGADGIGIEDIIINDDHTLTVKLSDGQTYTTEPVIGEKGDKGDQGEKGDRGERGLRGVGILQTFMNANYTLTLVYDDGSTYTTYPLRGERGEKGDPGDPAALRNLVDGNADGSARGVNTASEGYDPYYFMGENAIALGEGTKATGENAVAIGEDTFAQGNNAFASGEGTYATAPGSHAEGLGGEVLYPQSYNQTDPEGKSTSGAHGSYSHTEGYQTLSGSEAGHSEGDRTYTASGKAAHAEGSVTLAVGEASHAEGIGGTYEKNGNTVISGAYAPAAHTEGYQTRVASSYGHAEGMRTEASYVAHAEGIETEAKSMASHTEGRGTIANHILQHVFGEYNEEDDSAEAINDRGNYVEIVGNGTADNARSNARTLDWDGNEVLAGKLTVGADPTNDMDVATKKYVDDHGGGGGQGRDGITPTVTITPITGGNNIAFSYGSGDSRNTDVDVMDGVDGTDGQDGQDGADGVSPTVSVTDITGGHAVAITDASGTESFNVMDGTDGQNGTDGTDGTTFTPSVSSAGVISWTNDGGKTNPQSVDLVGTVEAAIIDDTLTQQGKAADAKAVGDELDEVKSAISEIEPGLSEDVKTALLNCFAHVVWDTPQASGYISSLENALYPSKYPKITTAFNPGTHIVYNVDTLDSLKPYLTVLYFETEESSGTAISNYTLSGELTGGTSQITATYNGLSSKFNVSVVDIDTITSWLYPSDITDKVIGSTQRVSSEDTRCVVNTDSTRWIVGNTIAPIKIKDTPLNDMGIAPIKVPDGCTGATVTFTYTGSASDVKYLFTRLKKEDGYYKVITWTSQANSGDRTAFTSSNQYLLLTILSASAQEITPTSASIVFDSNS